MNKGLLALNIILLVAVGVIFVLYFGKNKGAASSRTTTSDTTRESGAYKLAYFDMDSVENNFAYWKDLQVELNKKEDSMSTALNKMLLNLQQKADHLQQNRQNMTPEQFDRAQNELMQLDGNYKTTRQVLEQRYQGYLVNRQQEILSMIREFFKEYNRKNEYAMIIANEPGIIFYKDTTYNITNDLLIGLDKIYKERKGKK